jgi:hypothetical protein
MSIQAMCIRNPLITSLTVIVIILIYNYTTSQKVLSDSPSFSLQGIYNNQNNWSLGRLGSQSARNITECMEDKYHFPSPHIAAANYISDGNTLNATLWLSSAFVDPAISSSNNFRQIERSYALMINVGSVYKIDQNYQVIVKWDPNLGWRRIIEVSSPAGIFRSDKFLDQKNNYTKFFTKGKSYIDLSLNLNLIGSPSEYSVISYATDTFVTKDFHVCHLVDTTDALQIPPPQITISTIPSSLVLYPGQNKSIELQIKSNADLNSHIYFSSMNQKGINLKFIPDEIFVLPSGFASLQLQVNAAGDAKPQTYSLHLITKILFPTTIKNLVTSDIFTNPSAATITKSSNFTVTVIEPLSFDKQIKNVWESWGLPVYGFVGLITAIGGGGIVGWFLKKFKGKFAKDKNRSQNDGW